MNNYQLYKTNILLGGQVCWDITLDSDAEYTYISDFHLTPINHNIPYSYLQDQYDLNYTHQYNIKRLYKSITGNFYNGHINSKLLHDYPIISDNIFNTHENTYEMGVQRTDYQTYGKTFEFFCPLWLEQLNGNLRFEFYVKNSKDEILNLTTLNLKEIPNYKFHNNFINYFKNYIKYAGIDKGNDDIIKIDLSNKISYIKGLEITSGNINTSQNMALVNNILSRERPLMEFDSMIINSFKLKNMICNQLFNFRFHFNKEDVFPSNILKFIDWGIFKIGINVYIDDENGNSLKLDLMDLYTNFNFIDKKQCIKKHGASFKEKINVLNYLNDDKCIDLLRFNKIYQPIIHWSLYDNNDYIFNIYDGFSGFVVDDNKNIIDHEHLYMDSPDIYQNEYSQALNNIGWCNYVNLNNLYNQVSIEQRIEQNVIDFLNINELYNSYNIIQKYLTDVFGDKKNYYIHNVKYDISKLKDSTPIYVLNCIFKEKNQYDLYNLINIFELTFLREDNQNFKSIVLYDNKDKIKKLYCVYYESYNLLLFLSADLNKLTFAGFKKYLSNYINNLDEINLNKNYNKQLNNFLNILNTVVDIPIVRFNKSLMQKKAPSPSLKSQEIEYYKKNEDVFKYLFRYDGKIKPTFLTTEQSIKYNEFFYKNIYKLEDFKKDHIYTKYIPLKYPSVYPSLDYYPIKSEIVDYQNPYKYIINPEYKWYNNSNILLLPTNFIINIELSDKYYSTEEFENELYKQIQKKYDLLDNIIEYSKDKYIYEVKDDYLINKQHIYIVNLKLK